MIWYTKPKQQQIEYIMYEGIAKRLWTNAIKTTVQDTLTKHCYGSTYLSYMHFFIHSAFAIYFCLQIVYA